MGREPVRCILVGYGFRGRQWQETAARRRDVELAGVVDPEPGALRAAREAGLRAWESLEDALAEAGPEAAIIASPPVAHADQAVACLRRGARVLVEKPLATSVAEARRVADEAERAGTPGFVAQNFRFRRRELAIRAALADERVGGLRGGTIMTARPRVMRDSTRALPHAPLWDLGIHHLDLLRVRFGRPPDSVDARCEHARSTTYSLELRWEGADPVHYRLVEGAPGFSHFEWLQGERGVVRVMDARVQLLPAGRGPRRVRPPRAPRPRDVMLARLAGSDDSSDRAEPSLRDNVETVAMVEAAILSLEDGRSRTTLEVANA